MRIVNNYYKEGVAWARTIPSSWTKCVIGDSRVSFDPKSACDRIWEDRIAERIRHESFSEDIQMTREEIRRHRSRKCPNCGFSMEHLTICGGRDPRNVRKLSMKKCLICGKEIDL